MLIYNINNIMNNKRKRKKISQSKIAKELGVSQASVSIVLNNPDTDKFTEQTKRRILEAVRGNGYSLSGGGGLNIGYVIPAQIHSMTPYDDRFYQRFFWGIQQKARDEGMNLMVEVLPESGLIPDILMKGKVGGVILEPGSEGMSEESLADFMRFCPVVLLNSQCSRLVCGCIMPDNEGGIFHAFDYLYSIGHRSVGFFCSAPRSPFSHFGERLSGYFSAVEHFSINMPEKMVQLFNTEQGGLGEIEERAKDAFTEWEALEQPPTAVICGNDIYAAGLINAAANMGIRVPEDISVVGFDDIELCEYMRPKLTSVTQNMRQMGTAAVELLTGIISGASQRPPCRKITIGTALKERDSAGVPGGKLIPSGRGDNKT